MENETVIDSKVENDPKKTFSEKMGQLIGTVFVACVAACLSAAMIALTVRFVTWIF